jgi:hypothetical protein
MENQEYIIRLKDKTKDFTIVYNACFKDNTISMQAMGLFAYLMTLPNDWEIHKEELVSHFSNGRDAVLKAFDELIEKGYIVVEEIKGDKGQFGKKIYKVYEVSQGETKIIRKPRGKKENSSEEPVTDNHKRKTVTGNPLTENPILLNTDNTKDLLPSTNNKISSPQPSVSSDKDSLPQEENSKSHYEPFSPSEETPSDSESLPKRKRNSKSHCGSATESEEFKKQVQEIKLLYLNNYHILFEKQKVALENPAIDWGRATNAIKGSITNFGFELVKKVLTLSVTDDFCVRTGYVLTTVLSGSVFSRLSQTVTQPNRQSSSPRSYQQPRQFDENHLFF